MSIMGRNHLVGVGRYRFAAGQGFGQHSHAMHQVSWARSGVQHVEAGERRWSLAAPEAMWIPGGIVHDVRAATAGELVLLYLEPSIPAPGWQDPTAVVASAALAELVDRLPSGDPDVFFAEPVVIALGEVIEPVAQAALRAPMPAQGPVREVAEQLCARPGDDRTLAQWGTLVGASAKSLARGFLASTGMSFSAWRTQTRLHAALGHLADGLPVTRVAREVGYASASSFIVAFRRHFGHPPSQHFASSGVRSRR